MNLIDIDNIGKIREKYFNDLGIFTPEDLVNYIPYKYYDFSKTEPFNDDGKVRLIKCMAIENAKIVKTRNNLSFVSCKMNDEIGHTFTAIWYNQTYVKSQLFLGAQLYLFGKNSPTKKNFFIVQISKFCDKLKHLGLLPVYKTSGKIGQTIFKNSVDYVLQNLKFSSFISNDLLYKYNLIDINSAYKLLHNPNSVNETLAANERLEIERLIPLIAAGEYHKSVFKTTKLHKYNNYVEMLDDFENLLPYKLTFDQKTAIREISNDMLSNLAMNRMLQGDVGSGKTAVAFFASYFAAKCNHQAVIVAPTEILAVQHFENAKKMFKDIEIVLLTGNTKGENRKINLQKIKSGEAKIIIGTHALFSDNVEFFDLTFITIDEQHRFGVEQRKKLKAKGFSPDILVMSATPIPRSLSLIIYGDLDISILNSRPNKLNISTNIVMKQKQNDMWVFIKNKLNSGSKAYVVCSKIDEQLDDDELLQFSAKSMFNYLSQTFKSKIGLIHGKLSKEAQNELILRFKTGEIRLLVSTTVVEVGMDIPDADIIVIATPERFGLATLHQLRGRVGRNGQESYCFCLGNNLNEQSYNRIKFFKENSNGFKIAEYDLNMRGSGSIMGTNQHGKSFGMSFSANNYSTAKQILEKIKFDTYAYAKVLEKGEEMFNSSILSKIILN